MIFKMSRWTSFPSPDPEKTTEGYPEGYPEVYSEDDPIVESAGRNIGSVAPTTTDFHGDVTQGTLR
jgi:hypothetical protein